MPSYSAAVLTNTPFTRETLDWSRLACEAVNTVLRGLNELNRQGMDLEFSLHRIKENGFIFRLNTRSQADHRLFLLALNEEANGLKVSLLELDSNGAFVPMTALRKALADSVTQQIHPGLSNEYLQWKQAHMLDFPVPSVPFAVH